MANNLATLNAALATALRDTSYATWTSAEMNDLLTWSCAQLWPTISYSIPSASNEIPLVADTYIYTVPAGVENITDVLLFDSSAELVRELHGGAWITEGDLSAGTAKIRIAPAIVDAYAGGTVQLRGYGRYDLTTNYPLDQHVPLILARARAEAYRRVGADRERFKVWLARNQTQNVSVNELLTLIRDAEAKAQLLEKQGRVIQRPVAGRQ